MQLILPERSSNAIQQRRAIRRNINNVIYVILPRSNSRRAYLWRKDFDPMLTLDLVRSMCQARALAEIVIYTHPRTNIIKESVREVGRAFAINIPEKSSSDFLSVNAVMIR